MIVLDLLVGLVEHVVGLFHVGQAFEEFDLELESFVRVDDGRTIPSERMRDERVVSIGQGFDPLRVGNVGVHDGGEVLQRLKPSTDGAFAEFTEGHLFRVIIEGEERLLLVLLTEQEPQETLDGFGERRFGSWRRGSLLFPLAGRARSGLVLVLVVGIRLITLFDIGICRKHLSRPPDRRPRDLELTLPGPRLTRPILPPQPGLVLELFLKLPLSIPDRSSAEQRVLASFADPTPTGPGVELRRGWVV